MAELRRAHATCHHPQVIASHLPYDEIRGLKELFESMDADGSGTLSAEEIAEVRCWPWGRF